MYRSAQRFLSSTSSNQRSFCNIASACDCNNLDLRQIWHEWPGQAAHTWGIWGGSGHFHAFDLDPRRLWPLSVTPRARLYTHKTFEEDLASFMYLTFDLRQILTFADWSFSGTPGIRLQCMRKLGRASHFHVFDLRTSPNLGFCQFWSLSGTWIQTTHAWEIQERLSHFHVFNFADYDSSVALLGSG